MNLSVSAHVAAARQQTIFFFKKNKHFPYQIGYASINLTSLHRDAMSGEM